MTRVSLLGVVAALGVISLTSLGCSKNGLVSFAMSGSPRATSARGMKVGERIILAGDMHCHLLPPDAPYHVSRELPETLERATDEALDFVVLTPHVPSRFYMDEEKRAWVAKTQLEMRARLEALHPTMIVVPGFEYTDYRYGHVGASFADPNEVLAGLSAADAQANPERFFEMWVERGGVLTINHPVNRPLPNAPFRELSFDMSWRAYQGVPVPAEMSFITTHAQAVETYNTTVTELRDLFVVGDEDRSLREASHIVDQATRSQHRRIAAVGGTDSHGSWLRATTFVLAKDRSVEGIRKGIVTARTCVRGPEACTLEARPHVGNSAWLGVGDAITTSEHEGFVTFEGRATGDDVTFIVDGAIVAQAKAGEIATFPVPVDRCSVIRALVGRSGSSGIYVNCF